MKINPDILTTSDIYKLLTGVVVPRPIAWVTTMSPTGIVNLAPFSAFTFVSSAPPMVGINIGLRGGDLKDTARNIEAMGEYVVNIGDETMMEAVHRSAIDYHPSISEPEILGLKTVPSDVIRTPRLRDVPISLECRLSRTVEFGEPGTRFIAGQILMFHIRDGLCSDNKIDARMLRPICRLGGPNYARLGEIVSMQHVGDVVTGPR
ncbi:MAG: flavin reductase family protein [Methylobacteriaceae bacterium]|nr:flavin reductase family protein [Methylobacteriaceae bacterium]